MKMRFKIHVVQDFLNDILSSVPRLFEKNLDYLSLSSIDRSRLLHKVIKQIAGLTLCFITHLSKLIDQPSFYQNNGIHLWNSRVR